MPDQVTTPARVFHDWFSLLLGRTSVHGSGHVCSEERAISGVTGIDLRAIGHVHITVGDREALRVEAEDNLLPYLQTDVLDGLLEFCNRDGVWLRPTCPIHFYVTVKSLSSLRLSGSGDIEAPDLAADHFQARLSGAGDIRVGKVSAGDVQINLSGSGHISLAGCQATRHAIQLSGQGNLHLDRLEADDVDVQITGAGSVKVREGQVKTQRIWLSGVGNYQAAGVQSDTTNARISGSGSTQIHVRDRLEVSISGMGSVHYTGNPVVQKSVSGLGQVKPVAGE